MSNADTKRFTDHVSRISHEVLHTEKKLNTRKLKLVLFFVLSMYHFVLDRTRVLGVENKECCETQNKFNCHNLLRPHGVEGKSQLVVCV